MEILNQQKKIKDATIRSNYNGFINLLVDNFAEGNYVTEGVNIMSIVPEGNKKIVNVYIENSEIGKIEIGMQVKCEMSSYSHEEYGYLNGYVQDISKDIKVFNDDKSYYSVIIGLDEENLQNGIWKNDMLKQGMECKAKIIVEEKSWLIYCLEKVDLWD